MKKLDLIRKEQLILLLFISSLLVSLTITSVYCNTISNKIDVVSYDLTDDQYYISTSELAPDTLNTYANMNNTVFWDVVEGPLKFNHTMRSNITHYMTHRDEMGMNQTTIMFYYFPASSSFESGELNCTIFRHSFNREAESEITNRTYVHYLNYTDYLTFDWYDNLTSPISQANLVVNQSIVVDNFNNCTIQTELSGDYWDLDDTADEDEQIIAYSASGEAEEGGLSSYSTIDFWPETSEMGTGYNPLSDASDAMGGGWTTLYDNFYGEEDESDGTDGTDGTDNDGGSSDSSGSSSDDSTDEDNNKDENIIGNLSEQDLVIIAVIFLIILLISNNRKKN
jgi:hypothetical protein